MTPLPTLPPSLDDLVRALRAAGLPVGAREVLRLHQSFSLSPELDQERPAVEQVRRFIAAALVHSPREQEIFDQVLGAWQERSEHWLRQPRQTGASPHLGRVEPRNTAAEPEQLTRSQLRLLLGVLSVVSTTAVLFWTWQPETQAPSNSPTNPRPTEATNGQALKPGEFRIEGAGSIAADPAPSRPHVPRLEASGLFLPLLGLFLVGTAALQLRLYHRRQRPPPPSGPPPSVPGPRRAAYLPLPRAGTDILDGDAARTMVWGVDRYRTENATPELDLQATANATAEAGGIPQLRFVPEQSLREVWIWLDSHIDDPAAEQYAEEIYSTLIAAGLPARIAAFDGYPDELIWDEGQRFRPQEMEGHRQTALVAVMANGHTLVEHSKDSRRGTVEALLRSLSAWEHLTFVDFSDGSELQRLLERHGLSLVSPEALPYVFGARLPPGIPTRPGADEGARAWSAALALSPRPPSRAEAYALRREASITASPWQLGRLHQSTTADLRWLHDVSVGLTEPGSPLDRCLTFWERRLDDEDRRRREAGAIEAWDERPARRFLEMERALLRLWRGPDAASRAATELTTLAAIDEGLAGEIRRRLGEHEPSGAGPAAIPLPWHVGQLGAETRQRLGSLGLDVGRGQARAPGRLGLATGLLAGLGLLCIGQGTWGWMPRGDGASTAPTPAADCPGQVGVHTPTGMRFVRVCAGTYPMGSIEGEEDEKPAHQVTLSEFWIGESEVSNAEFRLWMPNHRSPHNGDDLPVTNVDWHRAVGYCNWLDRSDTGSFYSLPTEAQWEAAARGSLGREYPWGDTMPTESLAVYGRGGRDSPEPVGSYEAGAGPFGTLHQAGNVWEWVRDCYAEDLYDRQPGQVNPVMMDEERCEKVGKSYERLGIELPEYWDRSSTLRVVRGGSLWVGPRRLRSAGRNWLGPERRVDLLGFRCVRGSRPQP